MTKLPFKQVTKQQMEDILDAAFEKVVGYVPRPSACKEWRK